jgi:hypothetical protein
MPPPLERLKHFNAGLALVDVVLTGHSISVLHRT